jgi:hypothetical protein
MKVQFLRDVTISYGPQYCLTGAIMELPNEVAKELHDQGLVKLLESPKVVVSEIKMEVNPQHFRSPRRGRGVKNEHASR